MIELKSGTLKNGIQEFYLNGLDQYEDFEDVILKLMRLGYGLNVVKRLDGIYSRTAIIEANEIQFKLIYHEDVGIYAHLLGEQTFERNQYLFQILNEMTHLFFL